MYLLNLTLGQFLALFGSVSAIMLALYLLDRSRRRQIVATLRFWSAAEQPTAVVRRRRIQQPLSLLLQLLSMALLLLAIAQLRLGTQAAAPRDHVLILETSAWMAARTGDRTLMDLARDRARAYIRAVPARDRIMLVRADALPTPASAFEPDRRKLENAIERSRPGATALNLDEALAFARRIQGQSGRRAGEVVFVGTGKIAGGESSAGARPGLRNLRLLPVPDAVENCGLRKIGLRQSSSDPALWEIYVAAHNYGAAPRTATLVLSFGAPAAGAAKSPVGARRLVLPPGADGEATFEYHTRAAGYLEAVLLPHDAFPADDRAVLELHPQRVLEVAVYSNRPELLEPLLAASPRVHAVFRKPSEYRPAGADLLIVDGFRPPALPAVDSVWIDPPAGAAPLAVRARASNLTLARWHTDNPIGAGLRGKDFRLDSASIFEPAPDDIQIAEVESGPVIVARPGKPKMVVFGFHPALSAMRYELATPLLFANILRWMAPEIFRHWESSATSVGTVKMVLDPDVRPAEVRVVREDGSPVPFTLRDRSLHFFAGSRGTVRVLAGDREYLHSLSLPELWETRWEAPAEARRGIPKLPVTLNSSMDLWQLLALLGGAGLIAEWILFGRFKRGLARVPKARTAMQKAS